MCTLNIKNVMYCILVTIPGGTTLKRLQNLKSPECKTFQGFFFYKTPLLHQNDLNRDLEMIKI